MIKYINITSVLNESYSPTEIKLLNESYLIAEFMGEQYSIYPVKIPCEAYTVGYVWSYNWDGKKKKYKPFELNFHDSYELLANVYQKIFEYSLVSDSAKNLCKLPILTMKSILYNRAIEWITDNQHMWR